MVILHTHLEAGLIIKLFSDLFVRPAGDKYSERSAAVTHQRRKGFNESLAVIFALVESVKNNCDPGK